MDVWWTMWAGRSCSAILCIAGAALAGCGGAEVYDLVGTVERKSLELAAPMSEVIVDIPVALGQRVDPGAVIVKLDTTVAEAELRAGEASRAAAQALVQEQTTRFSRFQELRRRNVATAQDYDQARRARDEAIASVAEREARIAQASKHLEDLTVRSHAGGVVDQLPFETGERVPAGGVVAVIVADEKPWVRIWLPARAVAKVSREAWAEVRVEGFDEVLRGSLEDVSREPEYTPHYALTERESAHLVFQARIILEEAPANLRPGLPARVRLVLPKDGGDARSETTPAPAVPPSAATPAEGESDAPESREPAPPTSDSEAPATP